MSTPLFTPKTLLTPPIQRAAYSDRMAWVLAQLTQLAYHPFETDLDGLTTQLTAGNFTLITTFNQDDTQGFIVKTDTFAVLCFRGTEAKSKKDIKTDLKFRLKKAPSGAAHRGFLAAYNTVKPTITKTLETLDFPLYITGHSLGGALATLAAADLPYPKIAACYTYGSPRVGNRRFEQAIKVPVYRIQNSSDIVTRLPMAILTRYVHVGALKFLTPHNQLRTSLHSLANRYFRIVSFFKNPRAAIDDHSIKNYVKKLRKVAMERN